MTTQPATENTSAEKPKLSALIRRGAAMVDGRQAFGDYIQHIHNAVCLCAIGAAYYALTGTLPEPYNLDTDINPVYDTLRSVVEFPNDFSISYLNDFERMTFDEIAAALEARGL